MPLGLLPKDMFFITVLEFGVYHGDRVSVLVTNEDSVRGRITVVKIKYNQK